MTKSNPSTPRRAEFAKMNAAHKRMGNKNLKKRAEEIGMPRRAGHNTRVAWNRNQNKAHETLGKYRTGYRKAWDQPSVRKYMKTCGFKEPGTYNPLNQHGGEIFALPRELKVTNTQAGKIMQKCMQCKNLSIGNLKDIKKMLSYTYQLLEKDEGNWPEVGWVWKSLRPETHKRPDMRRKIKPTMVPGPEVLKKCFTTEYQSDCGMEFFKWNVGCLLTHDLAVFGLRQIEDINKIRDSKKHTFAPKSGWMSTELKGGRSKLEKHKGPREWKLYRVCLCPGGSHKRPPPNFKKFLDYRGNPVKEEPLPWCTTCPLNAWECIQSHLPRDDVRTYPNWNASGSYHRTQQVGEESRQEFFQRWIDCQKANPDELKFDSNCGRKSLAKWCKEFDVPYELSFEIHGDHYSTWKRYYQHRLKSSDMDRRTQSPDPDDCCEALREFARGIGRGKEKEETLSDRQRSEMLKRIMMALGQGQEMEKILGKKKEFKKEPKKEDVKKEVKTEDDQKTQN